MRIDYTVVEKPVKNMDAIVVEDLFSVVGKLQVPDALNYWKNKIGPSPVVMDWLTNGVPLYPRGVLVLAAQPDPKQYILSEEQKEWMQKELNRLIKSSAIKCLGSQQERPKFLLEISPVFLVPKKGPKKWRMVIDLRRLNSILPKKNVRLEGLGGLLRTIGVGWYIITWDLKDGYHHVMMRKSAQRFLGFQILENWYYYSVLPFGLSQAVWIFSKIMRAIVGHWRSLGLFCGNYLDDFWLAHPSEDILIKIRGKIVAIDLEKCGLVREPSKGQWIPAQRVKFFGLIVDTVKAQIIVPEEKIIETKKLMLNLVEKKRISARELAAIAGKIQSLNRAFAHAKVRCLEFYTLIDAANRNAWQWDSLVNLTKQAQEDAKWVALNLKKQNGRPAWKPSRVKQIFVDASTIGWSAVFKKHRAFGNWSSKRSYKEITKLEAEAVILGIKSFAKLLEHSWIDLHIDNQGAIGIVMKGGRLPWQKDLLRRLWELLDKNDIWISEVFWVPSKLNPADDLTRWIDQNDWGLNQLVFNIIEEKWGPHSVDRMPDHQNAKLNRFNSRFYCPGTEGVNCFTQDWSKENNYVCPPFALIHRVLQHIIETKAIATVIVPKWVSAEWWPTLMYRQIDFLLLPPAQITFVKGCSKDVEPWKNQNWSFMAVRIA